MHRSPAIISSGGVINKGFVCWSTSVFWMGSCASCGTSPHQPESKPVSQCAPPSTSNASDGRQAKPKDARLPAKSKVTVKPTATTTQLNSDSTATSSPAFVPSSKLPIRPISARSVGWSNQGEPSPVETELHIAAENGDLDFLTSRAEVNISAPVSCGLP